MLRSQFQKYFEDEILNIKDLEHKGNNQIFEINLSDGKYLLKRYSALQADGWNRGKTEFRFISHFWERGFKNIPRPINFYEGDNVGIYSFEEGSILEQEEVKEEDIVQIVDFLVNVHSSSNEDKKKFLPSREACLALIDYVRIIDDRIKKIINYKPNGRSGKRARAFVDDEVLPAAKKLKQDFFKKVNAPDLNKKLSLGEQVITPGDFGFHNVLVSSGKYIFLDFEYSGLDDPVKQIAHFKHQEGSKKIKRELIELFLNLYNQKISPSDEFRERFCLVEPLVIMDWVLHELNVLSSIYIKHLQFAHRNLGKEYIEDFIEERLNCAQEKFKNLKL